MISITRVASFSAAHRYYNPRLSDDENRKLYGSLYRDEGFGHNFMIEASFAGPVEELTGMIVNLSDIDRWLKEVVTVVDHKDLNQIDAFRDMVPTPEVIARFFFRSLAAKVHAFRQPYDQNPIRLLKVRVFEGEDFWADYSE